MYGSLIYIKSKITLNDYLAWACLLPWRVTVFPTFCVDSARYDSFSVGIRGILYDAWSGLTAFPDHLCWTPSLPWNFEHVDVLSWIDYWKFLSHTLVILLLLWLCLNIFSMSCLTLLHPVSARDGRRVASFIFIITLLTDCATHWSCPDVGKHHADALLILYWLLDRCSQLSYLTFSESIRLWLVYE